MRAESSTLANAAKRTRKRGRSHSWSRDLSHPLSPVSRSASQHTSEPSASKRWPGKNREKVQQNLDAVPAGEILFEAVYQGGSATRHQKIVEIPSHSGRFFVLRCDECTQSRHFDRLCGATSHLKSHPTGEPISGHIAVKRFGYLVLGCTRALAGMNNIQYEVAKLGAQPTTSEPSAERLGIPGQETSHAQGQATVACEEGTAVRSEDNLSATTTQPHSSAITAIAKSPISLAPATGTK